MIILTPDGNYVNLDNVDFWGPAQSPAIGDHPSKPSILWQAVSGNNHTEFESNGEVEAALIKICDAIIAREVFHIIDSPKKG